MLAPSAIQLIYERVIRGMVCARHYTYILAFGSVYWATCPAFSTPSNLLESVPFTIGWRCHFQTIAHDPPSVPFLFYTCMHVDQPGDTLLARVYLYNFVLSVCVACYSLISSSVHVKSRSNLQHVRQWCVFF